MDFEKFVQDSLTEIKNNNSDFQRDISNDLKEIKETLRLTCERLTVQENNYKNHIENEAKEREQQDKNLNNKYTKINTIIAGISIIAMYLGLKSNFA